MTKTGAILKALHKGGLTLEQLLPKVERNLKQVVGRQRLYSLLAVLKANDQIDTTGRGDERIYMRAHA